MTLVHSPDTIELLAKVADELLRQDELWGTQDHPDGTGLSSDRTRADSARNICSFMFDVGEGTWRDILWEEVAEALAETEPEALEEELLQVAAVAVQWVLSLRRRNK